jgi:hypothetical protein
MANGLIHKPGAHWLDERFADTATDHLTIAKFGWDWSNACINHGHANRDRSSKSTATNLIDSSDKLRAQGMQTVLKV